VLSDDYRGVRCSEMRSAASFVEMRAARMLLRSGTRPLREANRKGGRQCKNAESRAAHHRDAVVLVVLAEHCLRERLQEVGEGGVAAGAEQPADLPHDALRFSENLEPHARRISSPAVAAVRPSTLRCASLGTGCMPACLADISTSTCHDSQLLPSATSSIAGFPKGQDRRFLRRTHLCVRLLIAEATHKAAECPHTGVDRPAVLLQRRLLVLLRLRLRRRQRLLQRRLRLRGRRQRRRLRHARRRRRLTGGRRLPLRLL